MKTKTIFKTLALAMLMPTMLLTTACSSEDDVVNTSNITSKGYALPVTVSATRQDGATRASYNESTRKLEFSAGDKLFVWGYAEGYDCEFAGELDYVPATEKFSGTIYTSKEWTGTADALFTAAASEGYVNATLLPAGYGSYGFLTIEDYDTEDKYDDFIFPNKTYTLATSKAAGVEQFSYEEATKYDNGFALSPNNAILNFTITGLAASTSVNVSLTSYAYDITGTVTTDAFGTATFAAGVEGGTDFGAGVEGGTDLNSLTLTVAGNPVTLVSSEKMLEAGKIYNITRSAASVPTGVLNGVFSVSSTKQVKFSKGNLQATYNGSTWTWAFAEHQYDYIGNAEGNTKVSGSDPFVTGYTGSSTTVDLFGWSTSTTYLGINNSTNNNTYSGDTEHPGVFVDWGSHADVIAGIGSGWFTLSSAEWAYLFGMESNNKDKSGHARYRKYFRAQVNGVSGIVFLPDDISGISNIPAESSRGTSSTFSGKTYTTDAWSALESAGCVFLPAAGGRSGSSVYSAGTSGAYWSATPYNAGETYYVGIYSNTLYPGSSTYSTLEFGNSVRLVYPVQ